MVGAGSSPASIPDPIVWTGKLILALNTVARSNNIRNDSSQELFPALGASADADSKARPAAVPAKSAGMGKARGTYTENADIIRKYAAAYLPAADIQMMMHGTATRVFKWPAE